MKYFEHQELKNYVTTGKSVENKDDHDYTVNGNSVENLDNITIGIIQNKKLIENADETDRPGFDHAEVSFNCLGRFMCKAIERLEKGKIKLVDSTEAKYVHSQKSPGLGFTKLYDGCWHSPGYSLLYDTEKKMTMLFGQDEDQYFGVELPRYAAKVDSALKMLMPKQAIGKRYLRQGEWFAVPVTNKEIPKINSCLTTESIILMLETEDSNQHWLTGEIRIKDNIVFARNFNMSHDQHKSMNSNNGKWYAFYKNNAVRSFSQEGVD